MSLKLLNFVGKKRKIKNGKTKFEKKKIEREREEDRESVPVLIQLKQTKHSLLCGLCMKTGENML